jgi:hypothetical protein
MCDEEKDNLDKILDEVIIQEEAQYEALQAKIQKAVGSIYHCIIEQMLLQLPDDVVEVCEFNFEHCKKLETPSQQKEVLAVLLKSYHQDAIELNYRRKYNKTQTRGTLEVEFPEDAFILVKKAIYL